MTQIVAQRVINVYKTVQFLNYFGVSFKINTRDVVFLAATTTTSERVFSVEPNLLT